MKKEVKIAIILVVVLVLGVGAYFLVSYLTKNETTTTTTTDDTTTKKTNGKIDLSEWLSILGGTASNFSDALQN